MRITKRSLLVILLVVGALVTLAGQAIAAGDGAHRGSVKFEGVIESRPSGTPVGTWVIGGKTVEADETTVLVETKGPAEVGAKVVVIAKRIAEDALQALTIRVEDPATPVEEVHIRGLITELGTDYLIVNGLTVQFTADTRIEGALAVGASVNIKANSTAAGYLATKIEVRSEDDARYVEFEGVIESFSDSEWVVGGRTVAVNLDTQIAGTPAAGLKAEVRALVQADATLLAVRIKVEAEDDDDHTPEEVEFEGIIVSMPAGLPAEWIIGGRTVTVTAETIITGTPEIGLKVEVAALRDADGKLTATSIVVETPEPTRPPRATRTPTSTPTEGPSPTATATRTRRPTETPGQQRVRLHGAIVSFPAGLIGEWVIGADTVQVTSAAIIHGVPEVGLQADGVALRDSGGTLTATTINIAQAGGDLKVPEAGPRAKGPVAQR